MVDIVSNGRRFYTDLVTRQVYGRDDENVLVEPLLYDSDVLGTLLTVPAGYVTDFASVPRVPFAYWLAGGCARYAAVVHDFLLSSGFRRAKADATFLEAMEDSGVAPWRRRIMHAGVRGYGRFVPDREDAE